MEQNTWLIPLITHLLALLIGTWIGYRLILHLEKRKEFNLATQPIREWLLKEIATPQGMSPSPSLMEMDQFISRLNKRDRERFTSAYEKQKDERNAARQQSKTTGAITYKNTDKLVTALNDCLQYTKHR